MPSGFEVVRSEDCDHDLELIFDHLFAAYSELLWLPPVVQEVSDPFDV